MAGSECLQCENQNRCSGMFPITYPMEKCVFTPSRYKSLSPKQRSEMKQERLESLPYLIVTASTAEELQGLVNGLVASGYDPVIGVSVVDGIWFKEMVKRKTKIIRGFQE